MMFFSFTKLTKKLSDKIHHKVKYTLRKIVYFQRSTTSRTDPTCGVRENEAHDDEKKEKYRREPHICTQNTKPQTTIEKQKQKCYVCWDSRRCGERAMTNNNHEMTHSPWEREKSLYGEAQVNRPECNNESWLSHKTIKVRWVLDDR